LKENTDDWKYDREGKPKHLEKLDTSCVDLTATNDIGIMQRLLAETICDIPISNADVTLGGSLTAVTADKADKLVVPILEGRRCELGVTVTLG